MSLLLASEEATSTDNAGCVALGAAAARDTRLTLLQRQARRLVLAWLTRLERGQIALVDEADCHTFGDRSAGALGARILVRDPRCYSLLAFGGGIGAAEAYIRGYWDSPNLVAAMQVLAQNLSLLSSLERRGAGWLKPLRTTWHWLRRNTRAGSRRNIAAHYDLSNDFFALMLDPTMTYSSGMFESPTTTLEQSSLAKYDAICRKLQLTADDHVLEVGCGWGGFAEYAARHYGCRITGTTISAEQYAFAERRIREAGLAERVTLLREDYRDLSGQYDKLVSIEMIEAVGERYLDTYFGQCCRLLKPAGKMALQAITIPDHRYDTYRRSVDFIQRYIFPGGFLPSFGAIGQSLRRATDFRVNHLEDFGEGYATTLQRWRENFWARIDRVHELGFDERFVRTWHYYLCYCEAGFRERQIGVSQILLQRA